MLSPFAVLASGPAWVFALVFSESPAFSDLASTLQTFLVAVAGYVAMAVVMLAADRVPALRRTRGRGALVAVAAVVVLAAETRLVVILFGFAMFGLPDESPLEMRVVRAAVLALVCFGYAGAALRAWSEYREARESLLRSVAEAEERVQGHEAAVEAMSLVLREQVKGQLSDVRPELSRELDALKGALVEGRDGSSELTRLRRIADEQWRAVAGDAWRRLSPRGPRLSAREFAWAYALTRPFPLLGMAFGAAAMAWWVFGPALAPGAAVGALAVWVGVAVSVAVVAQAISGTWPRVALPVTVAGFVAILLIPLWLTQLGLVDATDAELQFLVWGVNLQTVLVLLVAGASPAIARNRRAALAALHRDRDASYVQQLQMESRILGVAREVAATLHGSSRSSFMAIVLQLDAALQREDRDSAIGLVERLRETILDAELAVEQVAPPVAAADIERVIENWRSVCRIDVEGEWSAIPPDLMGPARTVVVEGIADAIRHGGSSHISIDIAPRAEGVDLRLVNDGAPVREGTHAGLGTVLLDEIAPNRWSRDVGGDRRTQLSVRLRLPISSRSPG